MLESLIISKFGSDFTRSGDEMLFHCPYCPESGHRNDDRKLYVNSKSGKFWCHRCEMHGRIGSQFAYLFGDQKDCVKEMLKFIGGNNPQIEVQDDMYFMIPQYKLADYPDTIPYNYALSRGITHEMMVHYDIRAFGDGVQFHNRIVIPNKVKNGNWTDLYTSRAILDDMKIRYFNSKFSNKVNIVFNLHRIEYGTDIIVNEGPLNSIIAGNNSVALYGKYASNSQIHQIAYKNPKRIYISLDYDARKQALQLADRFHQVLPSAEIRLVDLPDKTDAADLGRLDYLSLVEDSKIIYSSNNLTRVFEEFLE